MKRKANQNDIVQLSDIRERSWINHNSRASKLLKLLIDAENILLELDEYQVENNQSYPEIEDMMLEFGEFREKYTKFIEKNPELLKIEDK